MPRSYVRYFAWKYNALAEVKTFQTKKYNNLFEVIVFIVRINWNWRKSIDFINSCTIKPYQETFFFQLMFSVSNLTTSYFVGQFTHCEAGALAVPTFCSALSAELCLHSPLRRGKTGKPGTRLCGLFWLQTVPCVSGDSEACTTPLPTLSDIT